MLVIVLALCAVAAWLLHPRGPFATFWRVRQPQTQGQSPAPQPGSNKSLVPLTASVQERMEEDGDYAVRVESSVPEQTNSAEVTVQFFVKQGANRWQREVKVRPTPGAPASAVADFAEPKLFGGTVQAEAFLQP